MRKAQFMSTTLVVKTPQLHDASRPSLSFSLDISSPAAAKAAIVRLEAACTLALHVLEQAGFSDYDKVVGVEEVFAVVGATTG